MLAYSEKKTKTCFGEYFETLALFPNIYIFIYSTMYVAIVINDVLRNICYVTLSYYDVYRQQQFYKSKDLPLWQASYAEWIHYWNVKEKLVAFQENPRLLRKPEVH